MAMSSQMATGAKTRRVKRRLDCRAGSQPALRRLRDALSPIERDVPATRVVVGEQQTNAVIDDVEADLVAVLAAVRDAAHRRGRDAEGSDDELSRLELR